MKINKKVKYGIIISLAIVSLSLFVAAEKSKDDFKLGKNTEVLLNMFRDINLFYVDQVDPDKLIADAAQGMVENLDPYTEYIPEKEMENFEIMTTGKYGGIGSLIRKKGDYVLIAQPYKGFPADKAGLKIGDKIVEIDGQDVKGLNPDKVSSMLKGDPGTTVKLKVEQFSTGSVAPFTIRRERIVISGVPYYGFISDSVGYILLSDFTEDCSNDLRKALVSLKESGKMKSLVLDLRNNGGGILQEAVKIVSLFVPKGTEVVSMKGKLKQMDATFKTESEPVDLNIPIAVLTNNASASAAEIVSGALQDLDRAVLVGQRTFGKGLVQSTRPLGYNSYLKITTAKYYIPSGRCIQAIDYAHRNDDGSVAYVADSLIKEFSTHNGRKVYDGGGVSPDIKLDNEYSSRFAIITYGKGYIEDFVDQYLRRNPNVQVKIREFKLPDSEYDNFVEFMKDKSVEFESESKAALVQLRQKAERERYLDKIKDQLDIIEKDLKDDKESNLKLYRNEISEMIENQIILRTHYSQGVIEHRLNNNDSEVNAAVKLLSDRAEYNKILTSQNPPKR